MRMSRSLSSSSPSVSHISASSWPSVNEFGTNPFMCCIIHGIIAFLYWEIIHFDHFQCLQLQLNVFAHHHWHKNVKVLGGYNWFQKHLEKEINHKLPIQFPLITLCFCVNPWALSWAFNASITSSFVCPLSWQYAFNKSLTIPPNSLCTP